MAHLYEVHTGDGNIHHVETDNHHDNHDAPTFERHLIDIIKMMAGGVATVVVTKILYRGRR